MNTEQLEESVHTLKLTIARRLIEIIRHQRLNMDLSFVNGVERYIIRNHHVTDSQYSGLNNIVEGFRIDLPRAVEVMRVRLRRYEHTNPVVAKIKDEYVYIETGECCICRIENVALVCCSNHLIHPVCEVCMNTMMKEPHPRCHMCRENLYPRVTSFYRYSDAELRRLGYLVM